MNKAFCTSIRERTISILSGIKAGTFERDEAIALSLLSAMAGESIFLLGLPGVGKSMIARRLKLAFKDASVFEYLMSRFSTPDEIFGPISISKLKDNDCYERITSGYLPEAEIVFLDEIWKAGPAIQNSLLTVLNEKIYLNGNHEIRLPMKGIISASNELPAQGEGLEALWDRFIIRYIVNPIKSKENFLKLLNPDSTAAEDTPFEPLSPEEYLTIQSESCKVGLPQGIMDTIYDLHEKLKEKIHEKDPVTGDPVDDCQQYYVSDRRWKKSIGILRMSACLNGRNEVNFSDMILLTHILWNNDASIRPIQQIVAEAITAALFKVMLEQFQDYKRQMPAAKSGKQPYSADRKNYVIQCDDSPLKIKIKDYNNVRKHPEVVHFGSETADGVLVLLDRGQFTIRFVKDCCLCINGYNYYLQTAADYYMNGKSFLESIKDSFYTIVEQLNRDIAENLFTSSSDAVLALRTEVDKYKERFAAI